MKTPLTDAEIILHCHVPAIPIEFTRQLERDLRWLLLGTFALYEDCPLNFAPETCVVFEKWKPEIYKMLEGK